MSEDADSSSIVARPTRPASSGRHPALERADEQMRGVDALLGGVVQLPGDAAALGLDRQPLALVALARQAAERVGRVRERADEQQRQREVDGERLGRDDLEAPGHGTAR